eukprot:CAMPEP_0194400038 /NCGR_PEP_ID=MMETSP0174-20130528/126990_1 /TAXON_ID=216777 /ORGANISM="Proboscia alata, Strain PI-D3" /LENGTH=165 /DNA_ID=CAMNT_0039196507 /DNA_START=163 /DNA_END=656 /DNA_ORIENTATION=-
MTLLAVLLVCWVVSVTMLAKRSYTVPEVPESALVVLAGTRTPSKIQIRSPARNLSRNAGGRVTATADVRGNLGPAGVVIQPIPGTDWITDRWQAASNMHGKNIPGAHWIQLDFGTEVWVERVVLDWEAAYADAYRLEGSLGVIGNQRTNTGDPHKDQIWTLFDGT